MPQTEGTPPTVPSSVILAIVVIVLVVLLAVTSLRVVREYERAVAFRLGRLRGPLGPGLVVQLPFVDKLVRVDLRVVTLTIPPRRSSPATT